MLQLHLVRHGESQDNLDGLVTGQRDPELTITGVTQANLLRRELDAHYDLAFSSSLRRAVETAQISRWHSDNVTSRFDALILLDSLKERNYGVSQGIPRMKDLDPNIFLQTPQGGESPAVFVKRLQQALHSVWKFARAQEATKILIVSHHAVMSTIAAIAEYEHNTLKAFCRTIPNAGVIRVNWNGTSQILFSPPGDET